MKVVRNFRYHLLRSLVSLAGVALLTFVAYRLIPVNATTAGFAYLLLVLVIASAWGFFEAAISSVFATLVFNFFFLPPIGTFTIADPQNWVALFSFLATSLIASRLSATAKRRASEAIERQQDVERLYAFSRAMLLMEPTEPFPSRLLAKLVEVFGLQAAALYDYGTGEFHRAGIADFDVIERQLRESTLGGTPPLSERGCQWRITDVRFGSGPTGSLALQGAHVPESVLQGIASLVSIGLERARAQELAGQIEAARQSEQLRTSLIDAMAHEFKTPLTLIKAATTSLLASPNETAETRREQLTIADEEADHLRELIDNSVEMARLDSAHIDVHPELSNVPELIREVITSMQTEIDNRPVHVVCEQAPVAIPLDRRLMKVAVKQLLSNALKYSPADKPVTVRVQAGSNNLVIEITDQGAGIPLEEQARIFERFYRSPSIKDQVPGSGLGLSIAHSIVQSHNGTLTVTSHAGETKFRIILQGAQEEVAVERGTPSGRR